MGLFPKAAACAALCGMVLGRPAAAQDADMGKAQFVASCGVCHVVDPAQGQRQGPPLAGVFGRKAGQVAGFAYSGVLAKAEWMWDEAALDAWIENSQAARPGTTMNYRQTDPAKRARVIAYLKTLSQP